MKPEALPEIQAVYLMLQRPADPVDQDDLPLLSFILRK